MRVGDSQRTGERAYPLFVLSETTKELSVWELDVVTRKGLAAVSSSFFAALYSAFGKYDVVHIHAEEPAFFCWLPKLFGKRVVVTIHGGNCF